jgi:MFS family permease
MHERRKNTFYGWRVVGAAFVLGVFGLGMGFHGPAIYLHAVHESRGWPLALVSTAVTVHFLVGAVVVANLPALHRRFGIPAVTKAGAILLAVGVFGWAVAAAPWQLFGATLLSGAGWVTMGVAAINAIVAPWFIRGRPAALAMAYNGGNLGGVVFSPLWAAAISAVGFSIAAAAIGVVMAATMWILADLVFARTPQQMKLTPDGDEPKARAIYVTPSTAKPVAGMAAVARSQIPDDVRRDGTGIVRADRSRRTPVLAAGSRAWRVAGGLGDGAGDIDGHYRPHADRLGDAFGRRPKADGIRQLRGADHRLRHVHCR